MTAEGEMHVQLSGWTALAQRVVAGVGGGIVFFERDGLDVECHKGKDKEQARREADETMTELMMLRGDGLIEDEGDKGKEREKTKQSRGTARGARTIV